MADGPEQTASLPDSGTTEQIDPALFARLKCWVRDSMDVHSDWYKEAEECFGFVAGRSLNGKGQWPGTSWQEMLDSGRQPVEFNRVGPIVDAVCGLEVNNRQDVKYLPRTEGDAEVNERLSSLGDWAREEAHGEDEESDMFRNAVICGRGATETRIDFDEEPMGKIVIDCLDPLECGVDPAARKPCFADRRYSWRYRDISTDEAASMFPGVMPTALDASWAKQIDTKDGGEGNKTDYPDETRPGMSSTTPPKTVRLVQIEWYERETFYTVAMPGADQPQEMSEEAWLGIQGDAEPQGAQAQKMDRRIYKLAFLGRNSVLDVTELKAFRINWTTGRYDRNKSYHYGIVRPMRDPQMLSNKTLSQVLHILNSNAKGGLLIEQGAFRNPKDAEKDWSNPAKTIILNEGGLGKIKDRTPPAMPQSLVDLQEFSLSSIRDVTGVSVEMLGLADREQAASLEYQRRQSAMTILASLFNGLRHYRKLQGRTMLEQLKLLPPGLLVRVLIDPQQAMAAYVQQLAQWHQAVGLPFQPPMQPPTLEQGQQMFEQLTKMVPQLQQHINQMAQAAGQPPQQIPPPPEPPTEEFMKQTKVGQAFDPNAFGLGEDARFDVIVDETPSSPNQKEAIWAAIQPFMTELAANPAAMKIVLKASPLPETVANELGDALAGNNQIPPQMQQMIQAGQEKIQELQQENAQLRDKSMLDQATAQSKVQDSDTKRIKAISDIGLDHHAAALEGLRAQVETLTKLIGNQGGSDVG